MSGNFSVGAASIPVLTSLATTVLPILSPEIVRGLHIGTAEAGFAIAVFTLGLGLTTPIAGRVVDRFGTTASLRAGGVVLALASVLAALAPTYAVLIAARLVQGAGSAAVSVGAFTVIARAPQRADRARRLGALTAGTSLMYGCGPLLGAALAATGSWRAGLLAPVIAAGAALVVSGNRGAGFAGQRGLPRGWSTRPLRAPAVARLLVAGSCLNAGALASSFLAPLELRDLHPHATVATVGAWLLPAAVIPVATALGVARSALPAARTLGGLGAVAAASLAVAGAFPTPVLIVLASGVATAGFAGAQVVLLTRLPERAAPGEVATVVGWTTLCMLLAGTVGLALAGLLRASLGGSGALVVAAAIPLLALSAWTSGDANRPVVHV